MRKITILAANHFNNDNNFSFDNTRVEINNNLTKLYLFNNLIAVKDNTKNELKITLAGWDTVTTRERLRGITDTFKRIKGSNYINGKLWTNKWFNVTTGKNIKEEEPKEDKIFGLMGAFLAMGNITAGKDDSLKDKIKYKERIVFATMRNLIPDWQTPHDWNNISDQEKYNRLVKIEETI